MGQGKLKTDLEQIKKVLGRCLKLRCPACGQSTIITHPFHIRHHCPQCMALFKREEGFFVGAILANVVTTELVILLVCFFCLLVIGAQYSSVLIVLFVMALVFPVLFYHHSWSLWLGFDFIVESLPKYKGPNKESWPQKGTKGS
jgi:ribosomal protein S27AE